MFKSFELEFAEIEKVYYSRPENELLRKIHESKKKVVIFGAGMEGGKFAERLCRNCQGKLVAFCDNFKTGFKSLPPSLFGGDVPFPIISPQVLKSEYMDTIIVVAVNNIYTDEILNQTVNLGFNKNNVFTINNSSGLYDIDMIRQHFDGYKWAYDFFKDDISKKIILNRIKYYLLGTVMEHSPCKEQYFTNEIITLTNDEVFVDAGCFDGDTIIEFIKSVNNKYQYIYGFEPDLVNFDKAKAKITPYKNIEMFNYGVWCKDDILQFNSINSFNSMIDNNGSTTIHTVSLDNILQNKQVPTFIKMDIEGAEYQAILGAKNIIKKHHPKLAICVYHKPEDIYELPKLINEMNHYTFTLRHYSNADSDTVLYAV